MISVDRRDGFTKQQVNRRKALAATIGGGLALSSLARTAGAVSGVRILDSPEQLLQPMTTSLSVRDRPVAFWRIGLVWLDDGSSLSRPAAKRS
jgi:hypothetical protein